jgi:hypothetical protein
MVNLGEFMVNLGEFMVNLGEFMVNLGEFIQIDQELLLSLRIHISLV